jgi:hydroxyethylthiazole kinase-like uncharacterized protein yjeF
VDRQPASPLAATPLDDAWIAANPLPQPHGEVDKNSRGRILVVGGCLDVPGGVRLTAEASFRAGAGKVRVATVHAAAIAIGTLLPEAAVLALPTDARGEIDAAACELEEHLPAFDAVVVGPAMSCHQQAFRLVASMLSSPGWDAGLVIDAAALMALAPLADTLRKRKSPAILTPHIGEMAALIEWDVDAIARDGPGAVREAARRYGAVAILKGGASLIADPSGALYAYDSGNIGLATAGSGDVLAGIVAALLARGCSALSATLWSVWLHGEAGRHCAKTIGPLGFLASDLLKVIPQCLPGNHARERKLQGATTP